jgi:FMN reductase
MAHLVISSSLNPASKSRVLALRAQALLAELGAAAEYVDLRGLALPACDGDACYEHPAVTELGVRISRAEGVILATPIYNYSAGASAKNLIELTGQAWTRKPVSFLCAAGGQGSYMAVMALANTLMLDFRSYILPRFVFAAETAFEGDQLVDTAVVDRLRDLTATLVKFSAALRKGGLSAE